MPSAPTHVAVSCDGLTLSVGVEVNDLPHIYFYDVRAFAGGAENVSPFQEVSVKLSMCSQRSSLAQYHKKFFRAPCGFMLKTCLIQALSGVITGPGSRIVEFAWNPVLASMLAVVFSNGSAALYMVDAVDGSKAPDCCTIPAASGVTCVSWSPKGKQLVAGKADGTLTQYKPDLKEAKTIPAAVASPVLSILWISTYQFLTAVKSSADPDSRPGLILVQSSKSGETSFTNYDDVNYRFSDLMYL